MTGRLPFGAVGGFATDTRSSRAEWVRDFLRRLKPPARSNVIELLVGSNRLGKRDHSTLSISPCVSFGSDVLA
jgi:hypothetical protein